jgi:hypothetical protein
MTVKPQVRPLVRTLSAPVRGVSRLPSLPHGHIADRACYSHDPSGSLGRSAAIPMGRGKRSVSVPRTLKGVAVGDFSDAVLCR